MSEYRDIDTYPLTNDEQLCLVIRETGTRTWGGHTPNECRFCCGILYSARQLREAGMQLDDDGKPVPRDDSDG